MLFTLVFLLLAVVTLYRSVSADSHLSENFQEIIETDNNGIHQTVSHNGQGGLHEDRVGLDALISASTLYVQLDSQGNVVDRDGNIVSNFEVEITGANITGQNTGLTSTSNTSGDVVYTGTETAPTQTIFEVRDSEGNVVDTKTLTRGDSTDSIILNLANALSGCVPGGLCAIEIGATLRTDSTSDVINAFAIEWKPRGIAAYLDYLSAPGVIARTAGKGGTDKSDHVYYFSRPCDLEGAMTVRAVVTDLDVSSTSAKLYQAPSTLPDKSAQLDWTEKHEAIPNPTLNQNQVPYEFPDFTLDEGQVYALAVEGSQANDPYTVEFHEVLYDSDGNETGTERLGGLGGNIAKCPETPDPPKTSGSCGNGVGSFGLPVGLTSSNGEFLFIALEPRPEGMSLPTINSTSPMIEFPDTWKGNYSVEYTVQYQDALGDTVSITDNRTKNWEEDCKLPTPIIMNGGGGGGQACNRLKVSRGTSLQGESFPLYSRFDHNYDSRRLYTFDVEVTGAGHSDSMSDAPEMQGSTLFETNVTNNPSAGKYYYEWTVDWQYDLQRETSRQAEYDSRRDQHIEWVPWHQSWLAKGPPNPIGVGSHNSHGGGHGWFSWSAGPYSASGALDTAHTHYKTCEREEDVYGDVEECNDHDNDPDTEAQCTTVNKKIGTRIVEYECDYPSEHYSSTRSAYYSAEPVEPSPPGYPNPYADHGGGTPYNPTHTDGNWYDTGDGLFGGSFTQHPDASTNQVCQSEQLVVIAPVCSGVSGRSLPVGLTGSASQALYRNPNAPIEAKLETRNVGFTIPTKNHHGPVGGTGPNNSMPPNTSTAFPGSPTKHNLPGSYSASWRLEWYINWGDESGWPQDIDTVDNQPRVTCGGGNVVITSQSPTCSVRRWDFEVEDPLTKVSVTIHNPNRVPIAIGNASYNIQTIGSGSSPGITTPGPSFSPTHHLIYSSTEYPDTYPNYVPSNDSSRIFSGPSPYHIPERYNYTWQINAFSGVISWNISCSGNEINGKFLRLAYLPYIKAYEGGVAAGGRFGTGIGYDACDGNTSIIGTKATPPILALGQIFGFRKADGDDSAGASSEYALRAFGQITGYYSASQRDDYGQIPNGFNQPHLGLSFANNNSLDDGGNYGAGTHPMDSFANRRCIAHYWSTFEHARAQITDIATSPLDISDDSLVPAGSKLYHDGDLTIFSNNNTDPEINTAIFTEGDLYITSDIYNNERAVWHSTNRLGVSTIYLITKGNVFIDKDVRRIDAIIIALPDNDPTTDGTVYTCSDTSQTRIFSNHHRVCSKQLTINGAVIARSILLGRTNGSRNLGHPFEHPQPSLQANPTVPNADNVAEIFYFSPEYYVALPVASFIESQVDPNQYYRSDSIISLPPLF